MKKIVTGDPTTDRLLEQQELIEQIFPTSAVADKQLKKIEDRAMKWEPIETAPKDEAILAHWSASLGFNGEYEVIVLSEQLNELSEWYEGNESPTHWMPLPEPPE